MVTIVNYKERLKDDGTSFFVFGINDKRQNYQLPFSQVKQ